MKKISLIFYCLVLSYFAKATTYYFSQLSGDDSRSATTAQNSSTPWKTIDKLNSIFSSLQPGDAVLFKRGETFYGSINISNSGATSNPIIIGAYGSGANPIITGLTSMTNWVNIGNNIYEEQLNTSYSSLNMVTFQDTLQPIGRWPKTNTLNAGYLFLQSHVGTSSITSNAISSAPNFSGGEVVIRAYGWLIDRAVIQSQSSNTINYSPLISPRHPTFTYAPQDGYGFFFQNHINTLTQLGDWMYDKSSRKIRMYFAGQNPYNYNVNVSTLDNLVVMDSKSYITFDGLTFKGANSNTFNITNSSNITIQNSTISYSGADGVYVTADNSNNISISGCTITNNNNNGITGNSTSGWNIQNNIFNKNGLNRGMGLSGDGQYCGISHVGSNSLVQYNDIRNTGYIGIEFDGNNVSIKNNFIDSFCVIKSDGGGIYNSAEIDKVNRKVTGNIVLDGIGDVFGRSQAEINNPYSSNVHGIYMDGGAAQVEINGNTVANGNSSGIELSSPLYVNVLNNTVFNNKLTQVFYFESKRPISNLTVTNNILFAKKNDQLISIVNSTVDQESSWGTIDANYYCRPVEEPVNVDTSGYSHSPSWYDYPDGGIIQCANYKYVSLDKWHILSGQDLHSVKTPTHNYDLNNILFYYNASTVSKTYTLNGSYYDVKSNVYNGSITLAPYTSAILIKNASGGLLSQTISFPALPNKIVGDVPYSPLSATSTSGLSISYRIVSGPATLNGTVITLTGAGTVVVEAAQTGNSVYYPATPVTQSFTVSNTSKLNQTITFNPLPNKTFGDAPFLTSGASASSGLFINYKVISGPATISGSTITLTGTGVVTMEASQPGNATYNAAPVVDQSFNVSAAGKLNQTVFLNPLLDKTYGDPPYTPLSGGSSSGLPITIIVLSGPAVLNDNTITLTGVGKVTMQASQAGNSQYNPATPVTQSFNVLPPAGKTNQTITFNALPNRTFGDAPFLTSGASASSGLFINYKIVSGPATITGSTITLTGTGVVTIEAQQPGDATYNPAPSVDQSFTVLAAGKLNQTITFNPMPNRTFGDAPFLFSGATTSSGLFVNTIIKSGPATINGSTITLTGTGVVTVEVSQPGNATYNAATPVDQSFTVLAPSKLNQTITFNPMPNRTFGDAPFLFNGATASSGLFVNTIIKSGPATITGSTITLTGTGVVTVEVSQPGNATYNAATPVDQSFTVLAPGKLNQTIFLNPLLDKVYGDPPYTPLSGGSSSGLPIKIIVLSGPAVLNDNTITLTGVGTVTMQASQAGNSQYNAAAPVTQSFYVHPAGTVLSTVNQQDMATVDNLSVLKNNIHAYPNPFQDVITIKVSVVESGDAKLLLYNMQGLMMKQIFAGKLDKNSVNTFTLNSTGLASGMYMLGLTTNNKVLYYKISLIK